MTPAQRERLVQAFNAIVEVARELDAHARSTLEAAAGQVRGVILAADATTPAGPDKFGWRDGDLSFDGEDGAP